MLHQGKIVAIKGLGGFHLACDANNPDAVSELRRRKLRVDKPFAIMLADIDAVNKYCLADLNTIELLESIARPIVIIDRRPGVSITSEVAPGQKSIGVMLPYTPIHHLLFNPRWYDALVMTSGNVSEEPIVTGNEEAREQLSQMADAFLMHNRDIHIRCDDSVVRSFEKNTIPIRRSRGYAPYPVRLKTEPPSVLACGAELKNTFCLTHGNYAFLSHHIGDLENMETLESFEKGIAQFERIFRVDTRAIAHDLHPDYLATRYAQNRASQENLPAFGVQHHHAHIVACMVDNQLAGDQPVIGVAFDGTGYGTDGTIWGGEFLVADFKGFERMYHLETIPLPGGDLAVREPWRIALSWLNQVKIPWDDRLLPVKYLTNEPTLSGIFQQQWIAKINSPLTSSMGRLFDAASALSGIRLQVNYEGQAAIEFEAIVDPSEKKGYPFEIGSVQVRPDPLIHELVNDVKNEVSKPRIAARFHNGVAEMTAQVCEAIRKRTDISDVALSGGVWQNLTLFKGTLERLRSRGFRVYSHHQVPPNDGGIALGQAVVAATLFSENLI